MSDTTPASSPTTLGLPIVATGHSYVDVASGTRLDAWFPGHDVTPARSCLAETLGFVRGETVTVTIDSLDTPPVDLAEAYLRLHLLSRCQIRPNEQNLDGIFGLLTNVAWTSAGPVLPEQVDAFRAAAAGEGIAVSVYGVDKFPRMVDYVIPVGVRLADADRARLGAHLSDGTTVMHEGFCNFNAGTLGPAMVEGRISQGVVLGAHSDLGGSASIMGTLSGGGKEILSVGEHCLIGANAGIGISLGDGCTVEAGLYVTAGTVVSLPDGSKVKAGTLSGRSGMLLLRNSVSGAVEMRIADPERWGGINAALHDNN